MSQFVKMFSGGEKVKKTCQQDDVEKLQVREELLLKKEQYLKKKIEQELQFVKTISTKNRKVALQALRRKKWYEKHLKNIDSALKAITSAHEHIDIVIKMDDLMKDFKEEPADTLDMSDNLHTSVSLGLEFDEGELLAELERLEKNLAESLAESREERVSCQRELSTASPSNPVTESPPPPPPSPEPEPEPTYISRPPPTILITAPSQEDLFASPPTMTIADALKERRPLCTPFIVGNKLVTGK
ncbi:charged multivesicular body protein 4b-like [Labrus bergylta]|uniref:charged multivesicular body protein 4b-like n=1 Tax=Labrus bergylta TaxID=56723 RepID=UPI003313A1B0